ncbi:MAG: hypothetical protein NTW26_11610 [bacterium]|nr:hypothetical protein [bacterium]
MKPKNLIILAAFAVLVLTVGVLHFGQQQTQAAAQYHASIVTSDKTDTGEGNSGDINVWLIKGTVPADGFVSCQVSFTDGRVETVPLDGSYVLDDRCYFLVSLFPAAGDWGATVRISYNRLDRNDADLGADRIVMLEKVAPQLPADRPKEGFVWRGEELPGCNVWRWEVNL